MSEDKTDKNQTNKSNIHTLITDQNGNTNHPYRLEEECYLKLNEVLEQYQHKISFVAVLGILELLKSNTYSGQE